MMAADVLMLVMCSSFGAGYLPYGFGWLLLLATTNPMTETLDNIEAHRDEENSQKGSGQHAADYDRSQHLARNAASARGSPQGNASEDECEGGHKDRTQSEFGARQRGVNQSCTLVVFHFCEFDDQDGVLCGQSDQHDQPNLGVHIVLERTEIECDKCPKYRDGHAQEDAKRKRPAFVLCRHDEEDDKKRQTKNRRRRHALSRFHFLV